MTAVTIPRREPRLNIHDPSRSGGLPISVTEICPGTIYALGGNLPADRRCAA